MSLQTRITDLAQRVATEFNTFRANLGSIGNHDDVDLTTPPTNGNALVFDGTNFVPQSFQDGFTIFPVWAEESADLNANAQEWAFGNGNDTPSNMGVVVPVDCELFAMGLSLEGGTATVRTVVDGNINLSTYQVSAIAQQGFSTFPTPLAVTAGQRINFRTIASSGADTDGGLVVAWFRRRISDVSVSLLGDLMDVSAATISNGQILQYNGTVFVPASFPMGVAENARFYTPANTTTNLNQLNFTDAPVFAAEQVVDGGGAFTLLSTTQVRADFTGFVKANANLNVTSVGQRNAIQGQFAVDGNPVGPISSSAYIRNASNHNEASLHNSDVYFAVTSGQVISYRTRREGGTNTSGTTMVANASQLTLKQI